MGITDNQDEPDKFTFPPGTTLAPGAYRVLYADNDTAPPGLHLGFTLKGEGDDVHLFDATGMLLDSVRFGLQLADLSIGRVADGSWALTQPTFGAANVAARTGDPRALRLNEWLAASTPPGSADFLEVFNPGDLPVALGGLFLTDHPLGIVGSVNGIGNNMSIPLTDPFAVATLSFIAGGGFRVFYADDNEGAGADHLNFELAADQGMIALFDTDLTLIDCFWYGPQTNNVSQGRSPNGAGMLGWFDTPTPGFPNPGPPLPPGTHVVINEVLAANVSYNEPGTPAGTKYTPDWVELFNPTVSAVDLGGMSLSDAGAGQPPVVGKFTFPPGTTIPALGYRVIACDGSLPASATNTGFGLKANGGAVYLYDKPANGSGELDAISYGLQATDYSLGRVPSGSSNVVLCTPSRGAANVPVALGNRAALRINEWMNNPASGPDWFELFNPEPQPVELSGLLLTDRLSDPTQNAIPARSFIGTGLYGFQRFDADSPTPPADPDHVNFRLNNSGEAIYLFAPGNVQLDGVTFGNPGLGNSQGRLPDGSANPFVIFTTTQSPGDANWLPLANVVVNEVLTHTDPPFDDAIELHNPSGAAVDIGGWWLSDQKRDLKKYRVPNGTVIPAGGFRVFYEHQFNPNPNLGTSFSLDASKGDQVYLAQAAANGDLTGYRASQDFGAASNAVSHGRYTNSVGDVHFVALSARTFGFDNPDSTNEWHLGTGLPNAYPLVGPLVFSEIMYHPPDLAGGVDNVRDEFVELQNITGGSVALYHPAYPSNTWRLRDGVDFEFPPGTVIPAGGFVLVVSFDPVADTNSLAAFRAAYSVAANAPIFGPYRGKLDNGGETLELEMPDAPVPPGEPDAGYVPFIVVERVKYDDTAPWSTGPDGTGQSLQRLTANLYGNDPANWQGATPTPGPAANPDSDGDGMPDAWEQENGLVVGVNDAGGDADGDGLTNLEEYRACTDPQSAASTLRLTIEYSGAVVLQFQAVSNKAYTVEFTDSLNGGGSWSNLVTINAAPATGPLNVTNYPPSSNRFYRVRTP
jgi:hypothetical protein